MEIKFIESHQYQDFKQIGIYCFGKEAEEWFDKIHFIPDSNLGVFEGQKLAAALKIMPYDIFFHGKTVAMGGISTVVTLPEYRHLRYASSLLIESLKIMRAIHQIFSMLGPFSYQYYRQYGWELAFHYKKYRLPIEDFRGFGKGSGFFKQLTKDDLPRMSTVYEAYARNYNGAARRTDETWDIDFKDDRPNRSYVYGYFATDGEMKGYLIYRFEKEILQVKELVSTSPADKWEMLRFISLHYSQAREVIWEAPSDDNTLLMLKDQSHSMEREINLIPGFMVRVVDLQQVLEAYPFGFDYEGAFTLKVEDGQAPWNNEPFQITVRNGKAQIEKAAGLAGPYDLECTIQAFSQMIIGYVSLKEAREMGRIKGRDEGLLNDLERLFPQKKTYIREDF